MSEAIYLAYINSASRKDANSYFEDTYQSDKFIKLTKKVINTFGDTLMLDIYKPILYQQIYNQQKNLKSELHKLNMLIWILKLYTNFKLLNIQKELKTKK